MCCGALISSPFLYVAIEVSRVGHCCRCVTCVLCFPARTMQQQRLRIVQLCLLRGHTLLCLSCRQLAVLLMFHACSQLLHNMLHYI